MHHFQAFCSNQPFIANPALRHGAVTLTSAQAYNGTQALQLDATGLLYSAFVSFGDALRSFHEGCPTWCAIKLYYTTFYALRGLSAYHGWGLFYVGSKPYYCETRAGQVVTKITSRTSHQAAFELFRTAFPNHRFFTQTIASMDPFKWLTNIRETANYRNASFPEPNIPAHFAQLDRYGIRGALAAYLADTSNLYTFDPDHAALAFPLSALFQSHGEITKDNESWIDEESKSFLRSLISDNKGPLVNIAQTL